MEMQFSGPSGQVYTLDPSDAGQPGSCPHGAGPTASPTEAFPGFLLGLEPFLALSPQVPLCPDSALPQGPSSNVFPFLTLMPSRSRSNTIFVMLSSLSATPFLSA